MCRICSIVTSQDLQFQKFPESWSSCLLHIVFVANFDAQDHSLNSPGVYYVQVGDNFILFDSTCRLSALL